jgi:serine protease SohB
VEETKPNQTKQQGRVSLWPALIIPSQQNESEEKKKRRKMKKQSRFLCLLLVCVSLFLLNVQSVQADEVEQTDDTNNKDSVIEANPEYVEPESDDDDYDEYDEESEYIDDDNDEADIKIAVERALEKSKLKYKKSLKKFVKNRAKMTLALAVFAFRREIRQVIAHVLKSGLMDPKTGKIRLSPTQVLKLILFVDFMRRMQKQNSRGGNLANPDSMQSLAFLGQSNPVLGALLSKFLGFPKFNPAYIPPINQHYTFERVNEKYLKDGMALHKAIHAKHEDFTWPASSDGKNAVISAAAKKRVSQTTSNNETIIILDFTKLGQVPSEQIRDQVSFVLSQYRSAAMTKNTSNDNNTSTELEVVVVLESPGGSAVDFGLASQQLLRLRKEPGILLTICVDRVAASGGYMLACTASPGRLFAAPFSIVGSIGVLGQIVNVNQLLENWGIKPIVFRGGKDKAPLGIVGEITKDAKAKTQSMIDETHKAFKKHVATSRPVLESNIDEIGTGDVWLGSDALDLNLIDRITTSDEYIGQKVMDGARVLKMVKFHRQRFLFGRYPVAGATARHDGGSIIQGVLGNALKGLIGQHQDSASSIVAFRDNQGEDDSIESAKLPLVTSVVQSPKTRL